MKSKTANGDKWRISELEDQTGKAESENKSLKQVFRDNMDRSRVPTSGTVRRELQFKKNKFPITKDQ